MRPKLAAAALGPAGAGPRTQAAEAAVAAAAADLEAAQATVKRTGSARVIGTEV